MKVHLILFAVVSAFLLVACTPGTQPEAVPESAAPDTAAIRQAGQARMEAVASGNLDSYLDAYEDEAVWMPPSSEEIVGKAAARQRMQGVLDQISIEPMQMVDEEVVLSPDWVLVRGTFANTRTSKEGGEPEESVGTFLTMWHRQEDGSFKIAYDIWNSDRPLKDVQ